MMPYVKHDIYTLSLPKCVVLSFPFSMQSILEKFMTTLSLPLLKLKKGEDRRIRAGHCWIYSNEIDTKLTPLKMFAPGQEVLVEAHDKTILGIAYINPHSLIAARIISRDPRDRLNIDFFRKKIQDALYLRTTYFDRPYYRLVFSEGDYLPGLVIDRFGDDFTMQTNTAGMDHKKEMIGEALVALLPTTRSILLRNDSRVREHEKLETAVAPLYGVPLEEVVLEENGVTFSAPLWKGQKTGWFYDHRMTRARLQSYVKNKRVLDVFSYLGAFGIQAACFGAKQVTCIDASATACDYIAKNAALNQVSDRVQTICEDAFIALKNLVQEHRQYDVIILDPPAFVKKIKDKNEGMIAYQRVNELALKLLASAGILFSCSCSMHISMEELAHIIARAANRTQTTLQLLERGHQGADHPIHFSIPETDYLKTIIARKIS